MIKLRGIGFVIILTLLFISCKKDDKLLGTHVQPANDALSADYTNTLSIVCYSKKYDFIASYNDRYRFLGNNIDPYFGSTNVGLYLNANLNASNWDFGSNAKMVSSELVLIVNSTDFAGDKTALNSYSVFLLDSSLSTKRVYLSTNENLHSSSLVANTTLTFTSLSNGKLALVIPIDTTFSGKILRGKSDLVDNETFLAKYKGFYIKTAASGNSKGTIFKCDLEDESSGYFLNYKLGTDSIYRFRFLFSGNSAVKFNTIKHDFTNAHYNLVSQLNGDTAAGTNNLFLKGLGATKLRLYIPELKHLSDTFNVAVNRAEVSVYIDNVNFSLQGKLSDNERYNIPAKLALIACDSTGKENYAIDQTNTIDAGRYDGGYDSDNKRYVFNIARHVQAILNGKKKNYGFYLVVADPDYRYTILRDNYIDRVVLAGSARGELLKPRLSLSYIKFKNP